MAVGKGGIGDGVFLDADGDHLRGRDPGRHQVDATADVGGQTQGGGEGVDCACGVGEDGEAGYGERGADGEDVVCDRVSNFGDEDGFAS